MNYAIQQSLSIQGCDVLLRNVEDYLPLVIIQRYGQSDKELRLLAYSWLTVANPHAMVFV